MTTITTLHNVNLSGRILRSLKSPKQCQIENEKKKKSNQQISGSEACLIKLFRPEAISQKVHMQQKWFIKSMKCITNAHYMLLNKSIDKTKASEEFQYTSTNRANTHIHKSAHNLYPKLLKIGF
jgi:hypothetical protein